MERIVIIGCGGSGKSTLARQLSYGYLNEATHAETYDFKNRRQLKRFLKSL